MQPTESIIFTPCKIGPIELKNRTIRSAAFENMCKDNRPSQQLFDYHTAVARGGVGMTTVAAFLSTGSSGCARRLSLNLRNLPMQFIRKVLRLQYN